MIDFKDFKKTKEDADTVTMAHHKGHTIKILKRSLPNIQQEALKRLPFDDGGKVPAPEAIQDVDLSTTPAPTDAAPMTADQNGASSSSPLVPEPVGPQGSPLEQQANMTLGGVQQQLKGQQQLSDVQAQQAQQSIPLAQQAEKNADINKESLQRALDDVTEHTNEFARYMQANKINPTAYGESQTDSQKSQTALGLFLGGLGGGNGPNPALEFLNDNINRNIAAQKQNQEGAKTIYGAYQALYNNDNASAALTKVAMNDRLAADANEITAKLGTAQAQAQNNILQGQLKSSTAEERMKAAGYIQNGPSSDSGNSNALSTGIPGGILSPNAQKKYEGILYDPTKTPEQKADLTKQYNNAVQVDKAIQQIDMLFPEIHQKASGISGWANYAANKVDPNVIGGVAAAGTEALGAAGAIPTAGASLLGAVPGAIAAGGVGRALGSGVKQGLTAIGGRQAVEAETAKASLISIIGSALKGANVTSTEVEKIAEQFAPSVTDNEESYKDKLEKLKAKIKALTETSALDASGMTNKQK